MRFDFTIDDVHDCILETEQALRDVISSILTREYGPGWIDNPNIGWSNKQKQELTHRLENTRQEFPMQSHSSRLIDYSYIPDLSGLIKKNEKSFRSIFNPIDRTRAMLGIISPLRNLAMHPNEIPVHQRHLCLGICGELLQAIERWKQGFSRKVMTYSCDFRFDEFEGRDQDAARARCLENRALLIEELERKASIPVTLEKYQGGEEAHHLLLREGKVTVRIHPVTRSFYQEGYAQSASLSVTTDSQGALNRILDKVNHPYWTLDWVLSEGLDVGLLVSKVREITGTNLPASSLADGVITGTTRYIIRNDTEDVRIDIYGQAEKAARLILAHDGKIPNSGFIRAHHFFTPDIVLSIVYDEIQAPKIRELITNSTTIS